MYVTFIQKNTLIYLIVEKFEDPYEGLSDEELKEIFEDMQADYWIDCYE